MKKSKDNKKYPFSYDYWVDKKNKKVYAVVEYNDKITDDKHSNLYFVETKYIGE